MNLENSITLTNNVHINIILVFLFQLSIKLPVDDQACLVMVTIFRLAEESY
jgi:hypothetical protein